MEAILKVGAVKTEEGVEARLDNVCQTNLLFVSDCVGECLSYCGPVQFFNFLFHASFRLEADKESFRSQLDAAARKRKVEVEDELNVKKKKILEDELNAKKKKIIEEEVDAKKSRASKVHTSQYFSFLQISIEITRCSKMPASSLTMSQTPPLRNQQPLTMSFLRDLSRKVPTLPSQRKPQPQSQNWAGRLPKTLTLRLSQRSS